MRLGGTSDGLDSQTSSPDGTALGISTSLNFLIPFFFETLQKWTHFCLIYICRIWILKSSGWNKVILFTTIKMKEKSSTIEMYCSLFNFLFFKFWVVKIKIQPYQIRICLPPDILSRLYSTSWTYFILRELWKQMQITTNYHLWKFHRQTRNRQQKNLTFFRKFAFTSGHTVTTPAFMDFNILDRIELF